MRSFISHDRIAQLTRKSGRQVIGAAAVLAAASLVLRALPFKRAISFGSTGLGGTSGPTDPIVREWVIAVIRAARLVPWRSVCIHQGLALQWLLRKRGVPAILVYGTRVVDSELQAHVWVVVDDQIVLGGEEAPNFHEVARFPLIERVEG